MANRNNVATVAKRKATGKPFVKGDPRCHRKGQITKKRLEFNKNLRDLLINEGEKTQVGSVGDKENPTFIKLKKVEWLVRSVWQNAILGESWAVNFIAERTEGKVTQPIDHSGETDHNVWIFDFTKNRNGNNEGD